MREYRRRNEEKEAVLRAQGGWETANRPLRHTRNDYEDPAQRMHYSQTSGEDFERDSIQSEVDRQVACREDQAKLS